MIDDTVIDEGRLRAALAQVAEAEPVSASAMARLLDALEGAEAEAPALPTHRRLPAGTPARPHRRRVAVAVASIVIVTGSLMAALGGHATATNGGATTLAVGPHGPSSSARSAFGIEAPAGAQTPTTVATPAAGSAAAPAAGSAAAPAAGSAAAPAAGSAAAPAASDAVPSPADSTRVVKNGQVDLVVRHGRVEAVVAEISLLSAAQGGYVSSTSTSLGGGAPSGTVVVEIPEAQFELVVDQVRALGRVEELSTSGRDVTSQYVDLQAQITAAQQAEQRYLTILGQATSIGDILAVQQQIDSIDTQLQQLQGQQQLLDQQTTYGTLSVSVAESSKVVVVAAPSGWSRAWHNAVNGFAAGAEALVSASGLVAFVGLCLLALVAGAWLVWRRARPRVV
jgi:hypothetical protein